MWLFIGLCLFGLFVLFLYDINDRFGRSGRLIKAIPGPKPWPLVGNIISIFHPPEKLFTFQRSLSKLYGDINQIHGLGVRMVNIHNPDDIETIVSSSKYIHKDFPYRFLSCWLREGLLLGNGNKWHQRRKMLTKTFHFNILKTFCGTFIEETQEFLKRVEDEVGKPRTSIIPLISSATLRIMCETAMGKLHEDSESSIDDYLNSIHVVGDCFTARFGRPWLQIDSLFKFTNIAKVQNHAVEKLTAFTNKVIKYRREYLKVNDNVFDQDLDTYGSEKKLAMLDLLLKNEKLGLIDNEGIREEVDTFTFAGHDTTAIAMTFLIMTLANEPKAQEKVYEEICQVFGDSDRKTTMDDLNQLKYLECCIKESLRLYPSVPGFGRKLTEETVIGGYTVPADTTVAISIFDLHHREDLYPDADKFIPERFLPENCVKRHAYAYIPFSAGPRNCIGQKFALLEVKAMISGLLRKYRLEPVTKPSDLVFKTDIVLRTVNPIYVKFCSR